MSAARARPSLLRSAGVVGFMTLLSRITGMLQSRLLANYLGAGLAADAFMVAFRIPNLLRRFTAEGTMTAAFLPTVNEVESTQGAQAGREMVARFLGTLGVFLTLLCALSIPAMGLFTGLQMLGRLAPEVRWWQQLGVLWEVLAGTRAAPVQWVLTTTLARIMIPYLVLVSLTAGLAAVLNLRGRFGLPASVSTYWNLAFISFGWACLSWGPAAWRAPERAAVCLALATLVGGLVQLFVLWPSFRRLGFGIRWGLYLGHPGVRSALKRMAPGLMGTGIHPINVVISTILASQLAVGAQTVLFNSNMMGEMVLGIFAASVATVSLPAMSRLVESGDLPGLRTSLASALRGTAVLVIPGSVGMAVLAGPIIALIFQTGRYGNSAVAWTAHTVAFQAAGLLFIATGRIAAQCLYALKDYKRPAYAALLGIVVNVAASIALMGPLGTGGIALANGAASLAGVFFLTVSLRRRLGALPLPGGAGRAGPAWPWPRPSWAPWPALGSLWLGLGAFRGLGHMSLRLFPLIALCALVYAALLFAFRVPEVQALKAMALRRLRR